MAIRRYIAEKDTSITNTYKSNLTIRATGSNTGQADSLETFVIYGQADSGSIEKSRILIQFDTDTISTDRTNNKIPSSGSVDFYLKLYNAEHAHTLPYKFTLAIQPISQSWDEGRGVDLDEHLDLDTANWLTASSGSSGYTVWDNEGGDFHTASYTMGSTLPAYTAYFEKGNEDLEVNITSLVEEWIADSNGTATDNNGVAIFMTQSIETATSSSYTKRFFARSSEFFFKRPIIEARYKDAILDDRSNFYSSSSLADTNDNTNIIYLYNRIRGRYRNIPNLTNNVIYVQLWDDPISGSNLTAPPITGGLTSDTGIYTASISQTITSSYVYDRWFNSGLTTCYHTGTIRVKDLTSYNINQDEDRVINVTNLKSQYRSDEQVRFRIFTRQKNWNPNIYTVASKDIEFDPIDKLYYKINRVSDNLEVVKYLTGSMSASLVSRDISGSYFQFDMSLLEPEYMYEIKFIERTEDSPERYRELREKFKFRVEK